MPLRSISEKITCHRQKKECLSSTARKPVFSTLNMIRVNSLSKTYVCPDYVQIQKIPLVVLRTMSRQILDFYVQSLSKSLLHGQELYIHWTDIVLDWTDSLLFLSLDRHLTGFGQALDRDWIWCPISVQPPIVKEYRFHIGTHNSRILV